MLLTTAAVMKHQHMVEEKQVTTQMNPHALEPCPLKTAIKAPSGTYQISNLLGSDQPISRQAGKGSSVSHKLLRWTETGRTDGTDGSTRTSSASSSQEPASVRTHPLFIPLLSSMLLPATDLDS